MAKITDLVGQRFERLTVVSLAEMRNGRPRWACRCDCGADVVVAGNHLKSGATRSCGCLQRELMAERSTSHGKSGSRTYTIWVRMRDRCNNPKNLRFSQYGGRGIKVCDRWQSFDNFLADMGECPDGMSIDRVDANGNYEPGNCRWATEKTQQNNRTTNRMITFDGRTQSLSEWAREIGIKPGTLRNRIESGWSLEEALKKGKLQ